MNKIDALVGSLSHGHFNCLSRNILNGEKGCECSSTVVECKCLSELISDGNVRYSMQRLHAHDSDWAGICSTGLDWEMLDHNLDVEEPDGALINSVALNKQ